MPTITDVKQALDHTSTAVTLAYVDQASAKDPVEAQLDHTSTAVTMSYLAQAA